MCKCSLVLKLETNKGWEIMEKKTVYLFAYFNEWSSDGYSYSCFDSKVEDDEEYKFLCELEVPVLPKEDINKMGVAKLDKEIGDLVVQIEQKREKKQQLLAIEFKGE